MWKRKEEPPPPVPMASSVKEVAPPVPTIPPEKKMEPVMDTSRSAVAHIGKSVVIKGELSGSEDLYVDGQVEGIIELREHNLTVGPNGRVQANVNAKEVIVNGTMKGNVRAIDRIEIRKSGSVVGDLIAARVMIEDGAFFKGSIDIQKGPEGAKPAESKKAEAPSIGDAQRLGSAPTEVRRTF